MIYQIQRSESGGPFEVIRDFEDNRQSALWKFMTYPIAYDDDDSFRLLSKAEDGQMRLVAFVGDIDAGTCK